MDVLENRKNCCGCHACFNACPKCAIHMEFNEEGFLYPVIDEGKCIHCDICKKVCPILNKPEDNPLEIFYGAYAKEREEMMSSSSGGVASILSRKILEDGGIVCGAAYDAHQMVQHIVIEQQEELVLLKETKYVQSTIGNVYKQLEDALINGRTVLFTGTPCQVAGFKTFLRKDYEKLYCLDLICHGVPSPKVWERYLQEIAGEKKIVSTSFRNKSNGINHVTIDYRFENGEKKQEKYSKCPFIKGFVQNLYIRPSCHMCTFKGTKRCSDITVGDFWGMKEYHPREYHDYGISSVIIHSAKGKALFEAIAGRLVLIPSNLEEIACWNENLLIASKNNPKKEKFFEHWKEGNLSDWIEELTYSAPQKAKRKNRIIKILLKCKQIAKSLMIGEL